jgi:alcohol dehydrogenase YqhD (iron-dependent ADH family)
MIDEYYTRLATINSNPKIIQSMTEEERSRLKTALENVQNTLNDKDEEVKNAIENFVSVFNELKLDENLPKDVKTRSIMPKSETSLPRQILNDVTIMTLNLL